jgi:Tyrosine phosphatase family
MKRSEGEIESIFNLRQEKIFMKKQTVYIPILAALFVSALSFATGCSTMNYNAYGVPNLATVAPGVWHSGQPKVEAWPYLYSIGVRKVIKLNYDDETGYDEVAVAKAVGIEVIKIAIPPSESVTTVFEDVDPAKMQQVLDIIRAGGGVLWHCTHGEDRTMLVGGLADVVIYKKSRSAAWHNMIAQKFHWELPGLMDFWLDFVEDGQGLKLIRPRQN